MPNETNPRAVSGNNRPPIEEYFKDINTDLPKQLSETCGDMIERANDLVDNAKNVPDVIKSEEEEAKATDIVSQMKKHQKITDSRRLGINALPRESQAIINTFFQNGAIDPLQKAIDRIEPGVTRFKRIKAENERREREEKERLAREEADRQRMAAEEAVRKQRAAEAARAKALKEEQEAKERAARAIKQAEEAEERRIKAENDRVDEEVRAQEAKTKREKADAERKMAEAKAASEKAERERIASEESARRERENASAAKTEAGLAKGDLADANKEVRTAAALTKHAESDVKRAEKASDAKLSEVSGVRGDFGGHSSLRTRWVGTLVDRKKLDLTALRDFFPDDDLQKAINKFVSVHKGARILKGALIQEESDTSFR